MFIEKLDNIKAESELYEINFKKYEAELFQNNKDDIDNDNKNNVDDIDNNDIQNSLVDIHNESYMKFLKETEEEDREEREKEDLRIEVLFKENRKAIENARKELNELLIYSEQNKNIEI